MTTRRLAARLNSMKHHGKADDVVMVAVRPGEILSAAAARCGVGGTIRPGRVVVFGEAATIATIEANDVPEFHYVPAETIARAGLVLDAAGVGSHSDGTP